MKKFFAIFVILPSLLHGQIHLPLALQTPPKGTSYTEMIKFLNEIVSTSYYFELKTGTISYEKREIPVIFYPQKNQWKKNNTTVMLFAQQHGDEPSGKEALLMLVYQIYNDPQPSYYKALNLILIPCVNPDGSEADQRQNSRRIDLNRNHVILTEYETKMLHQLFEIYKPQVTLDIHEYGITSWLHEGYIKDFGEQLDCLSNMAIPNELKKFALTEILQPVLDTTRARGVKANRYLVCRSSMKDLVRHSTTDIDDGRNSFGTQYTLSFILEGAGGLSREKRIWERAKHQLTIIENFLRICDEKSSLIANVVNDTRERYSTQIPYSTIIQADYAQALSQKLNVTLKNTHNLKDTTIILEKYCPEPEAIVVIKRPKAYIVENPTTQILDMLKYQHLSYQFLTLKEKFFVEQFSISGRDTLNYEGRKTIIPSGSYTRKRITFKPGDLIISVNDIRANQIVQIFEPQSFYGISHYDEFQFLLKNECYPIYRIID